MEKYVEIIKEGGIGVIPTDTIYGLVGSVFSEKTVKKIKEIKGRSAGKGLTVLISAISDIDKFEMNVSERAKIFLKKFWPGRLSVSFLSKNNKFKYLCAKDCTFSFRFPDNEKLLEFLKISGPIIAPSANQEGFPPAKNITEAKKYFGLPGQGDKVDFYIDGGEIFGEPSTIVQIIDDKLSILREGAIKSNDIIKVWKEIK